MVSRLKLQKRLILHPWFPSSELIHLPQDWWAVRIHNLPKSWPKAGEHWRQTTCPKVDPRPSSTEDIQPVHKLIQGWLALKTHNLSTSWPRAVKHRGHTTCLQVDPRLASTEGKQPAQKLIQNYRSLREHHLVTKDRLKKLTQLQTEQSYPSLGTRSCWR